MILCPVQSPCRLTQRFGVNPQIYKRFGMIGHNGIDFTGENKGKIVPVVTPYDAQVWEVGNQGTTGYGKFIRLLSDKDGKGMIREIVLAHLSRIDVKAGDRVYLGDEVALMGNTGFSSGLHLHIGLRRRYEDLTIQNYNNGYLGYVDFEQYLLYWKRGKEGNVIYV